MVKKRADGWRTRKRVLIGSLMYAATLLAWLAFVGGEKLREQIAEIVGNYAMAVVAFYTGAKTFFNVKGGYNGGDAAVGDEKLEDDTNAGRGADPGSWPGV